MTRKEMKPWLDSEILHTPVASMRGHTEQQLFSHFPTFLKSGARGLLSLGNN